MSGSVNLCEHDVFLLRALVERDALFGVLLGADKTFRQCEVLTAEGERVCSVERDFTDGDIRFYCDAAKTMELLRVTACKRYERAGSLRQTLRNALRAVVSPRMYEVTDADGATIGVIEKDLGERQYRLSAASSDTAVVVIQEVEQTSIKGWVQSSRPFSNDRFAFWHGDRRLGSHVPDRSRTDSTIDMTPDKALVADRRLALAVSCLDVLRQRDEGGG